MVPKEAGAKEAMASAEARGLFTHSHAGRMFAHPHVPSREKCPLSLTGISAARVSRPVL